MPLKHNTETLLVFLLGLFTIIIGALIASVPVLPAGIAAWSIVFALSLFYPFLLYPLFRRDRADYVFRMLHFGPAAVVLLWLFVQVVSLRLPRALILSSWLTWTLAALPVASLFFLLELFCLSVIRQRVKRTALLVVLFVPFLALAASNGHQFATDTTVEISSNGTGGSMKSHSGTEIVKTEPPVVAVPPPRLPKSGMDPSALAVGMLAAYTTVLHLRAKRTGQKGQGPTH